MKTAEHKTTIPASGNRQTQPFFSKGGNEIFANENSPFFTASRTAVQTRLSVGQPHDKYEQEAETMANKVVQRLSSGDPLQAKPFTQNSYTPFLQAKCKECEEEEKAQKKSEPGREMEDERFQRKPIFDSLNETPGEEEDIQRKCAGCEEVEKLQKKETPGSGKSVSSDIEGRLSSTKGSVSPLQPDIRSRMESSFGADFSGVRIHNNSTAVQLSEDLHAQAFTYGNDIYFNNGKYDVNAPGGQQLLAHELTHTIQQGKAPLVNVQRKLNNSRPGEQKTASGKPSLQPQLTPVKEKEKLQQKEEMPVEDLLKGKLQPKPVFGGSAEPPDDNEEVLSTSADQVGSSLAGSSVINRTAENIQCYPKAGEIIPVTEKQKKYYSHRNDVVDIMGKSTFKPGSDLGNYIASLWEMGQEAAVNIKFGSLGEGFIFVKGRGYYIDRVCKTVLGFPGFEIRVCADIPPLSANYYADPQVIPLKHSAFKQDKGTPVLEVSLTGGKISGKLGWVNGKKAEDIHPLVPASTDERSFLPLIYGDDYKGDNYTTGNFNNLIVSGNLYFHSLGELEVEDKQKIQGIFIINNALYKWRGNLTPAVTGIEASNIPIERDLQAKLSGKLPALQFDKTWNFNGLSGSLHASFINGLLEITGNASYVPKDPKSRIKKADVTLMVTGKEKAWEEVRQRLPLKDEDPAEGLPPLYKAGEGLTIVGWGSVELSIIKKEDGSDLVTGAAALVLDPGGHLTVSGTIRLRQIYELMAAKGIDWKPISPALVKEFGPIFVTVTGFPAGAGLNFTGKGGLYYKYIFGPLTLHDISIQGIYSTNPIINKELSISGRLNLSAELNGKVEVTGRMAARAGTSIPYLGFDVSAIEVTVTGEASLKSYLDFATTLGVREVVTDKQKVPRAFVKGTIQLAGELSLGLQGKVQFEVLYGNVADKVIKGNWPVANAGIAIDFDYNIGDELSVEKLGEIAKFRKASFDRSKFVKGVLRDKVPKGTGKSKGGFLDEKGKKVADASDKPIPITPETIPTVQIKDDFNMEGVWHYLEIEIGPPGQPVKLLMATTPELLADKIRTEREKAVLRRKVITDDLKLKEIDQLIDDLDELQQKATQLIHRAQALGADPDNPDKYSVPGLVQLGNQIARLGRRYGLNNLGNASGGIPGGTKPSKDMGDGSYDYPIPIRWIKRGYHTPFILTPRLTRWGKIKPPPAISISAGFNSKTKLEVPPTQKRSFPGADKEERDGITVLTVKIGVDPDYQIGINDRIKRTKSSGKRSVSAKFRTLLANYHYDWEHAGSDADHALDLGWGGVDELGNIWPIYKTMNRDFANKVYKQPVKYVENGEIKDSIPLELRGKWFIIVSIGDVP
ncbi:MAG TPA: DUF4157 domain-containing protein [Bacteroidales bacterium]|nr:DUF4157 domain-containing protein [Bacteroidales bacterium]